MSPAPQAATPARRPVSVNGRMIPHSAIAREAQNHPAESPTTAWIAASRALAIRELLSQEARRLGATATPEVDNEGRTETAEEAAMRALLEQEVRTPQPTDDECMRYYQNNRARFRSATIVEAAHILIAAPPHDQDARRAAGIRAQALVEHLKTNPADFADLAAEFSACTSAQHGGSLGQLSGGDTVPEFETALEKLKEGEITGAPVESRYGFHVIRLDRRMHGRQLPFELVHERIRDYLREAVRRRGLAQYVSVLTAKAEIRGVEFQRPENMV